MAEAGCLTEMSSLRELLTEWGEEWDYFLIASGKQKVLDHMDVKRQSKNLENRRLCLTAIRAMRRTWRDMKVRERASQTVQISAKLDAICTQLDEIDGLIHKFDAFEAECKNETIQLLDTWLNVLETIDSIILKVGWFPQSSAEDEEERRIEMRILRANDAGGIFYN